MQAAGYRKSNRKSAPALRELGARSPWQAWSVGEGLERVAWIGARSPRPPCSGSLASPAQRLMSDMISIIESLVQPAQRGVRPPPAI